MEDSIFKYKSSKAFLLTSILIIKKTLYPDNFLILVLTVSYICFCLVLDLLLLFFIFSKFSSSLFMQKYFFFHWNILLFLIGEFSFFYLKILIFQNMPTSDNIFFLFITLFFKLKCAEISIETIEHAKKQSKNVQTQYKDGPKPRPLLARGHVSEAFRSFFLKIYLSTS